MNTPPFIALEGRIVDLSAAQRRRLFERAPDDDNGVQEATRDLLRQLRTEGDRALFECARRFDGVELERLEVPRERWGEALESLDPDVTAALARAARNIDDFHRAQLPADLEVETEPGVTLGRRFVALDAVGVYAPGGRATYPSSVLMGVVPAHAAGVREIVVCSPPGADGLPSAVVQAAAAIGGATRLFAVGGVGAVGAMAFGTESVPRCAAVVGPGNRWVLEAKRQVAGEVVIDSPAGPSELFIIAEEGCARPRVLAAELVAQAEHDPDAAVALVTTSPSLLEAVRRELVDQTTRAARSEIIHKALASRGALLLASDRDEMFRCAESYAAEHLLLCTRDPRSDLPLLRSSGTVFLGASASVAFGDYMTGANHVLPTAGTARSFSGLSVLDFLRSYTWQELTPDAAAGMVDAVATLANAEGLAGHAAAVRMRTGAEGAP